MNDLDYKIEDYVRFVVNPTKSDKTELGKIVDVKPLQYTVVVLKSWADVPTLKNRDFFPNELVQTVNTAVIKEVQVLGKVTVYYFSEFVRRFYNAETSQFDREAIENEPAHLLR